MELMMERDVMRELNRLNTELAKTQHEVESLMMSVDRSKPLWKDLNDVRELVRMAKRRVYLLLDAERDK